MCGIAGVFRQEAIADSSTEHARLSVMLNEQHHRGPDDRGTYSSPLGCALLGHNRLSILDLSSAGHQPMAGDGGRYQVAFNGEIYNYLELRKELAGYPFQSQSDTEVLLAAYERWGEACLERFLGMFAFLVWDEATRTLVAARDRFGVKPLYYSFLGDGTLLVASEISALHAAGVEREPDPVAWAGYLATGVSDSGARTFWRGIRSLPAGHKMIWRGGQLRIERWYDLAARSGSEYDQRPERTVLEEYTALLESSVGLRFRSDVPVGVNLSGGLDSALLLGLVGKIQGAGSAVDAYTFVTNDSRYDELPWVRQMLARTGHRLRTAVLTSAAVPALAASVSEKVQEPYGGIPTLAYARLFDEARTSGTIVLLDGQGMDEQWGGYDYYARPDSGAEPGGVVVQGTASSPVRAGCLQPDFLGVAEPRGIPSAFPDRLRNLQLRDLTETKIPRALRFNDRVSMRASTELREPFLDHRLVELALRQPPERKISGGVRKRGLREIARWLVPAGVVEAPKRPVQTPQREWLRGELREWASDWIELGLRAHSGWFDRAAVRREWREYCDGAGDNSFYVWQWITAGMLAKGGTRNRMKKYPEAKVEAVHV